MGYVFKNSRKLVESFCKEDYDTFIYTSDGLFMSEYSAYSYDTGTQKSSTTNNNIINAFVTRKKTYYAYTTLTHDQYSMLKEMGKDPISTYTNSELEENNLYSLIIYELLSTPGVVQTKSIGGINDDPFYHNRHLLLSSFDLGVAAEKYGVTGGEFLRHHKDFGYDSIYISNNSGYSYVMYSDMIRGAIKTLEPMSKFNIEKNTVDIITEVRLNVKLYEHIFHIDWQ